MSQLDALSASLSRQFTARNQSRLDRRQTDGDRGTEPGSVGGEYRRNRDLEVGKECRHRDTQDRIFGPHLEAGSIPVAVQQPLAEPLAENPKALPARTDSKSPNDSHERQPPLAGRHRDRPRRPTNTGYKRPLAPLQPFEG